MVRISREHPNLIDRLNKPHLCRFSSFCCVFLSVLAAPCPAVPPPLAFLRLSRPEPMLNCLFQYSTLHA